MYTDGPEMNFRTASLDFPQKEQRRCLSWDITIRYGGQVGDEIPARQRKAVRGGQRRTTERVNPLRQAGSSETPWWEVSAPSREIPTGANFQQNPPNSRRLDRFPR
jgi:hypothetical protein